MVVPQVAVRSVGILLGFGTSLSPLSLFPAAADLIDRSVEEQRVLLRDPAVRARLSASIAETSGDILGGMARIENVFPLDDIGVRTYETTFPEAHASCRAVVCHSGSSMCSTSSRAGPRERGFAPAHINRLTHFRLSSWQNWRSAMSA